jgi:hypothetical protein
MGIIDHEIAAAQARIDEAAETARARYITLGSGQAMTYLQKRTEAQAYKDAGYPADASSYPHIVAKATASGITNQQAADLILATAAAWLAKSSQIEQIREAGKLQMLSYATLYELSDGVGSIIAQLNSV